MKTIIFNSYKGHTNKTKTLVNFAKELAEKGKEVAILDWCIGEPNVLDKFNQKPNKGFIDYLMQFSVEERLDQRKISKRVKELKKLVVYPSSNISCITTGNTNKSEYWTTCNSYNFHKIFYFTDAQAKGLSYASLNTDDLANNFKAFENDKDVIQEACGNPDYLLIDTKGIFDANLFFIEWADNFLFFLPYNTNIREEYLCGSALITSALSKIKKKFDLYLMLSCIPEKIILNPKEIKEIEKKIISYWEEKGVENQEFITLCDNRDINFSFNLFTLGYKINFT